MVFHLAVNTFSGRKMEFFDKGALGDVCDVCFVDTATSKNVDSSLCPVLQLL